MALELKICEVSSRSIVDTAVASGVKYIGCSFNRSSMNWVSPSFAREITKKLPPSVGKIAVVYRPSGKLLDEILFYFDPDFVQFSGGESPQYLELIKEKFDCKIMKKFNISTYKDLERIPDFERVVDMFLFEPSPEYLDKCIEREEFFDWGMFKKMKINVPWMIAGEISKHNVGYIVRSSGATIIDVSGSLEIEPGKKDPEMIIEFMDLIRKKFI